MVTPAAKREGCRAPVLRVRERAAGVFGAGDGPQHDPIPQHAI
jgi:hypothetical protein